MANRKKDRLCVQIKMCVLNEIDAEIRKFQAERLLKGEDLKKYEAAERYLEMLHRLHVEQVGNMKVK